MHKVKNAQAPAFINAGHKVHKEPQSVTNFSYSRGDRGAPVVNVVTCIYEIKKHLRTPKVIIFLSHNVILEHQD